MKKVLSVFLVVVMIFTALPLTTFNLTARAKEVYYGTDGYYEYEVTDGEATITGVDSSISGNITIPSTLGGYPVTSIGYDAFSDCSSLTSVTIPNSVTNIGDEAFSSCRSLTSVIIPDSVKIIGDYAFYNCSSLTSVTIPDSVTSIGSSAFYDTAYYNNSNNWENNLLYIGNYLIEAKYDISGAYEIKSGTKVIADRAFSGCSSLTSVTIPNSVTSIGDNAFYDCISLTSVTIPNSVKSIGFWAFSGCSSLTSVTIPDSVTSIGSSAFYNTAYYNNSNNWENNVLYIGNYLIKAKDDISGDYEIKFGTKAIAVYAFYDCSSLTSVTIPNSVTNIGDDAFSDCSSLTSVTIPNSVKSIGVWAFSGCSSLTSVTIPNSVTSIGGCAFSDCSSLTSVIIGDSVTSIGGWAFSGCSNLTSVTIPNSVTSIGEYAFSSCRSLTSVTIGDSITKIGEGVFCWCESLTSVTIGDSVTSIGDYAFYGCDNLTIYGYRGSVAEDYALENEIKFSSITDEDWAETDVYYEYEVNNGEATITYVDESISGDITIPSTLGGYPVTSIGEGAFYDCISLTSVTIPNSVKSIGVWAFSGCSSLTSVTIPDSVTSIGSSAFYNTAYYNNSNNWENNVLYIGNYLIKAKDDISGDYEIKFGTKAIADYAFYDCSSLTSVTIPNSVKSIGVWAFSGCSSLTSVTIPNSVTSIGGCAFYYCSSLTSVIIGDSVTSIGGWAFSGCSSLTSVTIPNSVTSIGEGAFSECYNLTIYGYSGSVAETYAKENKIKFVPITNEDCSHKNTTVHPAKASTCKVQGNNKYTTCNDCGKVISGSNKKLPLAGHKYTTTTTKATLTKNGSVVKKCSVCGVTASTTTIYYPKTVSIAATTYTYTGKVITPAVTVKNSKGATLKNGTDYTLSYASGRKDVGKYKVTVTFKGNYSGTKTFYFTINPVKTTVSKLTAGTKSIKVAITKKSTQVTGYEVQYATSKTFKGAKTKTISSYKTTSVNLTGLSAKKTYYVRVRTYKTVGKTKYYSAWSTYKYTKTK